MKTTTMGTPIGPFTMILDENGMLMASGWDTTPDELAPLAGLEAVALVQVQASVVVGAVRAYFAGELRALDDVAVHVPTARFVDEARRQLRMIPAGTSLTYTQLAAASGLPAAVRAAAQGCSGNPVALFVPCHRVLRSDGGLGGYRYGLERKRWLLAFERDHALTN